MPKQNKTNLWLLKEADPSSQPDPTKVPASKGKVPEKPEQSKVPPSKKDTSNHSNQGKSPEEEAREDAMKYEMVYINGGFNGDGIILKPEQEARASLEISIYGGGQKKSLTISSLPKNIQKLIKAYEVGASESDSETPEITGELQKYFEEVKQSLSAKIISIFKEADVKTKAAIKAAFNDVNKNYE